jgi:ketosteroid isomerase-like protein
MHPAKHGYMHIHETVDPEVLICEFLSIRIEPSTMEEYPMPYVHVVRIRDGEFVLFRDYAPLHMAPPSSSVVLASLGRDADDHGV